MDHLGLYGWLRSDRRIHEVSCIPVAYDMLGGLGRVGESTASRAAATCLFGGLGGPSSSQRREFV